MNNAGIIKAVWLPYMFFRTALMGKSEESFSNAIDEAFSKIGEQGLNKLFVHARPFGDALYRSDIFPTSFLVSGKEGEKLRFDPLEIMIKKANPLGLGIEAWVNPFRVRSKYIETGTVSDKNPVCKFLETGDAIEYSDGIIYNPASQRARDLIVDGLHELCARYDIVGVHFDDYFYPNPELQFDAAGYAAYKAPGGGLSQAAWRKANISLLLKQSWDRVHSTSNDLVFGVSPKGFMECNLNEEYFDVPRVLSNPGYVDYICPQSYFAPNDEIYSFGECINVFNSLIESNIKLIVGLPVYKLGHPDPHAGAGEDDWQNGEHVLADMIKIAGSFSKYSGYSLYDYSSFFTPARELNERMIKERSALNKKSL